jgi:nitrite reductase (NADH) small subunit
MDRPVPQSWTRICEVSEIPRLGSRVLEREAGNVAIFRTGQDKVFALLDHCPHKGGALSQGIVHGDSVTCPLHAWNIALASGEAKAPDDGCSRSFPVCIDELGAVHLCLT